MKYFTFMRHPVDMLWSYYKFFKPDHQSKYTFSPGWESDNLMSFEKWICEGRLGANTNWLLHAPKWIKSNDLSVLALEFYACNQEGIPILDRIFQIENPTPCQEWLQEMTGKEVKLIHTNQSEQAERPEVGQEAIDKIRRTFRWECALYGV